MVGGRAKAAEDYSIELITEILRGIRDTADLKEECGDANDPDVDKAATTAGLMHDIEPSYKDEYTNDELPMGKFGMLR